MNLEAQIERKFVSRREAEDFLLSGGADPEDLEKILGEADDFVLDLSRRPQDRSFNLEPIPPYVTESVYFALSEAMGESLIKYYNLLAWLGENRSTWSIDVAGGTICLGERGTYPIQVLGTVSRTSETWLWSWANKKANIKKQSMRVATVLCELGKQENLFELTKSQFYAERINGMDLALLSSSFFDTMIAFEWQHQHGCIYILIENLPAELLSRKIENPRVLTIIKHMLASPSIDHANAVDCLL